MSNVTVLGGGIIGLWTAEVLSSRGHKVTVQSSRPIMSTCSSAAACVITPLLPSEWDPQGQEFLTAWGRYRRTIAKLRTIDKTRGASARFLERIPCYEFGFEENGERYLEKGFNISKIKNLPFEKIEVASIDKHIPIENHTDEQHTCSFYAKFTTDFCNTETFIHYLYAVLIRRGVKFDFTPLKSENDVMSMTSDVIFNCMGFESPSIFHDKSLYYIRGQSIFISQKHDGPYIGIASGNHAVFSHRKGFYIGSYFLPETAIKSLTPRETEYRLSQQFVRGPFENLCDIIGVKIPYIDFNKIIRINTGIRPFRPDGPRVEADHDFMNKYSGKVKIIHNYGHGAHGWTTGYASAEDAVAIAEVRGWLN